MPLCPSPPPHLQQGQGHPFLRRPWSCGSLRTWPGWTGENLEDFHTVTLSEDKKEASLKNSLRWAPVLDLKRLFVGTKDTTRMAERFHLLCQFCCLVMAVGVLKGLGSAEECDDGVATSAMSRIDAGSLLQPTCVLVEDSAFPCNTSKS